MCEYKKSCADEIGFASAEQMHAAALQISKTCFDVKKLCVTFLGASMAFLVMLTDTQVDHSLFIVALVLIVGFWMSDATAYFYQRRLRARIDACFQEIARRNKAQGKTAVSSVSVWGAMFNSSMSLYYVLGILYVGGWVSYCLGWIG